jgi:deoxyribonuclease-4
MSRAIERGTKLDCEAIQVFVKNASQWQGKPLVDEDVEAFRQAHAQSDIGPLVAHASYLINLAASKPDNLTKSRAALIDELERCHRLGIPGLVVHPGAHLGVGLDAGLELIGESLRHVLLSLPDNETRVLLENTAGQGTLVGYRLEHLARIRELADQPDRVGICIDTCHAFAAGYPLHEPAGFGEFISAMLDLFGAEEPSCFHLNDSKYEFGAKRDRHANLGKGEIPIEVFEWFLHEPTLDTVPMVLETPMGDDSEGHRRDLEILRSL